MIEVGIVGVRIYQMKLPQKVTYPAIRMQLVNKRNGHHLRGHGRGNPAL